MIDFEELLEEIETALSRDGLHVEPGPVNTLTVRVPLLDDARAENLPRIHLTALKTGAVAIAQYDSAFDEIPTRSVELPPTSEVSGVVAMVKTWFAWW